MSGFDAVGADDHFFHFALIYGSDPLKVGVEATFRHIMGVAHVAPDHWLFSADFTHFRHYIHSP